jgi:hypothetical protein
MDVVALGLGRFDLRRHAADRIACGVIFHSG